MRESRNRNSFFQKRLRFPVYSPFDGRHLFCFLRIKLRARKVREGAGGTIRANG